MRAILNIEASSSPAQKRQIVMMKIRFVRLILQKTLQKVNLTLKVKGILLTKLGAMVNSCTKYYYSTLLNMMHVKTAKLMKQEERTNLAAEIASFSIHRERSSYQITADLFQLN